MDEELSQTTLANEVPEQTQVDPADRRAVLGEAFDRAEAAQAEQAEQRARDEAGRFAKTQEVKQPPAAPVPGETQVEQKPQLTTWKKDYLPLQDKLAQGLPLTADEAKKLAAYNQQRESEYSTGVSVFKERATRLEGIEKAITPFMPILQQHNISPDVWINKLGTAHHQLAMGTPAQKLQAFQQLAQDYGVPLGGIPQQGQGVDPAVAGLMEQIQQLSGKVQAVDGWREQQEQQRVTSALGELASDPVKYPNYSNEKVRVAMAQLLESGSTTDLKTAYAEAEWMVPEVREQKLASLSQGAQAQQTAQKAVSKAKSLAISPKTVTPSGAVAGVNVKDRRAVIEASFDAITGRV